MCNTHITHSTINKNEIYLVHFFYCAKYITKTMDAIMEQNTDINITVVKNAGIIDTPSKTTINTENPKPNDAKYRSIKIDTPTDVIMEDIGIKLRGTIDIEPDSFKISNKRIIPKQREPQPEPVKMRSCGTWFDECFDCCCMPIQCMASSCRFCSDCCSEIVPRMRPVYFFIIYLFTGELNIEAVEYKEYFNIKTASDDQVNVPEILITTASIIFELYKTMIGSFLTVFTSQRCGQQTCTILENIVPKNDLELAGIICNFLMATTLVIEYIFEIMREAYLIKYLKYDKTLANNGEHIAELFELSDKNIFEKLIPLYIIYIRFSYVVLLVYFVNVSLSAVIVSANYYDNTSIFSFVTNALFIIYKIYNVIEITSYRGNYFYSAYKKKNIHYNSIKPQYIIKSSCDKNAVEEILSYTEQHSTDPENIVIDIADPLPKSTNKVAENTEIAPIVLPSCLNNITVDISSSKEESNAEKQSIDDLWLEFKHNNFRFPKKLKSATKDYSEYSIQKEKEEALRQFYENNYIDKKTYRKTALYLRKSAYGDVDLSEA